MLTAAIFCQLADRCRLSSTITYKLDGFTTGPCFSVDNLSLRAGGPRSFSPAERFLALANRSYVKVNIILPTPSHFQSHAAPIPPDPRSTEQPFAVNCRKNQMRNCALPRTRLTAPVASTTSRRIPGGGIPHLRALYARPLAFATTRAKSSLRGRNALQLQNRCISGAEAVCVFRWCPNVARGTSSYSRAKLKALLLLLDRVYG